MKKKVNIIILVSLFILALSMLTVFVVAVEGDGEIVITFDPNAEPYVTPDYIVEYENSNYDINDYIDSGMTSVNNRVDSVQGKIDITVVEETQYTVVDERGVEHKAGTIDEVLPVLGKKDLVKTGKIEVPPDGKKTSTLSTSPTLWGSIKESASKTSTWSDLFSGIINAGSSGSSVMDLMYDQEEMAEKRAEYDKNLQSLIQPGSTEYYMSEVCDEEIPPQEDGYAYVQDKSGNIRTAASISAEKQFYTSYNETNSTTGEVENQDKFIYKISYLVTNYNIDNVTINYRVVLKNPSAYYLTNSTELTMEQENQDYKVEILDIDYELVCIEFSGHVPRAGAYLLPEDNYNDIENPFCNRIEWVGIASSHYSMPEHLQ